MLRAARAVVRYQVSGDPIMAELARIGREIHQLRLRIYVLHGAIIFGGIATLERTLRGIVLGEQSRFFIYCAGVFVASFAAFWLSAHSRTRIGVLTSRAHSLTRGCVPDSRSL